MADKEIRTILAPLTHGNVLLPNSVVGEILNFTSPEPFKNAPYWLLGEIAWKGWQVPVINFERILNKHSGTTITSKTRILIIKTLGESTQVNYIGLIIQGLPRLKKVSSESLVEAQTAELEDGVFSVVSVDDIQAYIPELGDLTNIVEMAAYNS